MTQKIEIPADLNEQMPAYKGYQAFNNLLEVSEDLARYNEEQLLKLIADNKNTEYGKAHHFDEIETIEDFKEKVPFSSYDDYAPYIERMEKGERDLITTYPIVHYATTSGSVDNPKNIPVSDRTLALYQEVANALVGYATDTYFRENKGGPVQMGKNFLTSNIKVSQVEDGTTKGPISAAIYEQMKPFMHYVLPWPVEVTYPEDKVIDTKYLKGFYALKDKDITVFSAPFMSALVDHLFYIQKNWQMLVDDIEKGVLNPNVEIDEELREKFQADLKPDPERAAELREIFKQGFDEPVIPKIWPKVQYVSSVGGGSFASYMAKMKEYTGEDVPFYLNAYAASEALMGSAYEMEREAYALIPYNGFFEFIDMDDPDAEQTLNMDQLEKGKEYEIIITNLSGFYRYKIGDVIEVVDHLGQIPLIKFKYRKNQLISLAGEKTNEPALNWSVREVERESGIPFTDFSIFADPYDLPGKYVLLLEPKEHLGKEVRDQIRDIADEKLGIANPSYGAKVRDNILLPMEVRFLQPETYYLYRDLLMFKGVSENQIKPVHVIDTPRKERFFFALLDEED